MPGKGHEKNVGEINLYILIGFGLKQCVIFSKCEKNYVNFSNVQVTFVHFTICKIYLKYNRIENHFEL